MNGWSLLCIAVGMYILGRVIGGYASGVVLYSGIAVLLMLAAIAVFILGLMRLFSGTRSKK